MYIYTYIYIHVYVNLFIYNILYLLCTYLHIIYYVFIYNTPHYFIRGPLRGPLFNLIFSSFGGPLYSLLTVQHAAALGALHLQRGPFRGPCGGPLWAAPLGGPCEGPMWGAPVGGPPIYILPLGALGGPLYGSFFGGPLFNNISNMYAPK